MATETREKVLREHEFERLLDGANRLDGTDRIEARAAILLMGRLGMRGGEVTHFDASWVDRETELIQIPAHDPCEKGRGGGLCGLCRQAVQKRANAAGKSEDEVVETYWQPKTEGSVRDIPYGWSARTVLAVNLLLDEHGGWPHSFSTLQRRFEMSMEAAPRLDEDETTPHGLRGTAASYHAGEGMEPEALRAMMGWRDKEVVKKYLAINGEMVRRALAEVHG